MAGGAAAIARGARVGGARPRSRLHLGCISAASRLHLGCISAASSGARPRGRSAARARHAEAHVLRDEVTSYKLQVTSYKLQATSYKLQATSYKPQATSYKLQATTDKLEATGARLPFGRLLLLLRAQPADQLVACSL